MESDDRPVTGDQTTIAVLGTLAEFHQDPLPYDLATLIALVARINPDLLCLDLSPAQWQQQDFRHLPAEYRQALLPLAARTDMVVVPIGGPQTMPRATAAGWRGALIRGLRHLLARVQAGASGPEAVNQGWRHEVGNLIYSLTRALAGRAAARAYHGHIEKLAQGALAAARDNAGSRILVVTNIQYCHHIRPRLRGLPGIRETSYITL